VIKDNLSMILNFSFLPNLKMQNEHLKNKKSNKIEEEGGHSVFVCPPRASSVVLDVATMALQ
jgi:hypothetical protein